MLTISLDQLTEIVAQANGYKARTGLSFGPVIIGGQGKGLRIIDAQPTVDSRQGEFAFQPSEGLSGDGRWGDGR